MRVIKSLLLGAAAGLAATAGVQAADMPVKAKAVEYVKICSAYGAGFYYIPGTDICLRVGGAVRADYYHNAPGVFPDVNSGNERSEETHGLRGRGYVTMDARNNTPYGTLRAYINGYASFTTGGSSASAGYGAGAAAFGWDRAFIQFAGFTFGQSTSFYDFWSNARVGNLATWADAGTGATGWNVLAYTAQFGNGLSGTISIEDQRRRSIKTDAPTFGSTTNVRAGQNLPAVTAALRVDQAWGSAQVMAAWQELRTLESAGSIDSSGYAFGGGFTWNNPSAPGSVFGIQANYAKGAMGYVVSGALGAHNIMDGGPFASRGLIADGVVTGGALHKTSGWNVAAGYEHKINAQWAWSIYGGYAEVDYDATVDALCGISCSFDFWGVGSRLNWTPVAGLSMGLDIMYHEFGTATGAAVAAAAPAIPAANLRDNDVWSAMFRVHRTW